MVNRVKSKKAATLVELIMVILIVAIISVAAAGSVIFFVQLFIYSPRQLDVQKIGEQLNAIMIEGNQNIRGIRYARNVIDASAVQFSYTYGYPTPDDQLSVRFRWDSSDKYIYRSTSVDGGSNWSSESVIPYYMSSAAAIDGKDAPSVIFTYKKAGDVDWISGSDALGDIRRLITNLNIKTGTGSFGNFQGSNSIMLSVEIKNFQ